jgi:DNA-binding NarL/FixJ family response regulator
MTQDATDVLLADDHPMFREGLRAIVERVPGFRVVAETGDGSEALRLIGETRPAIALLDISLPGMNGLEVAAQVAARYPGVRVVILTAHADEELIKQALRINVAGYLVKDATSAELEVALTAVARGVTFMSPTVTSRLAENYLRTSEERKLADDGLTPRQRQVIQLIAEGFNTKEIAHRLGLSSKTVEGHRVQAMERLGIDSVAGLTRYAIRTGLIAAEGPNR